MSGGRPRGAEARGTGRVPSSSTVSTAGGGVTRQHVPKMGKKGRKHRVQGIASCRTKCCCFRLVTLWLSLPCSEGGASEIASSKHCCSLATCRVGKLLASILQTPAINSLKVGTITSLLGTFLGSWLSKAFPRVQGVQRGAEGGSCT